MPLIYLVVLEKVVLKCVPEANIAEVCAFGDKLIEEEVLIFPRKSKYNV